LYVILDVYSRYVVGWMAAHHEAATLAERLLAQAITDQAGRRSRPRPSGSVPC
jgi:putative transposase